MTSFFDGAPEPPAAPEPVEQRQPPWAEMAPNVLPVSVALDVVLVRTGDWAVWLGAASATADGVAFTLTVQGRDEDLEPEAMHPFHARRGDGTLRFGVGFADGRRAIAGAFGMAWPTGDAATEISLAARGGSGGQRRWSQSYWLWPLPPEGPLTFAFAWPAKGIAETTADVDTAPLRAAGTRSVELWPDDRPLPPTAHGAAWGAYGGGAA
jgi:hypothetical protein